MSDKLFGIVLYLFGEDFGDFQDCSKSEFGLAYHFKSTVIFLGACLGGKFGGVRKAGIGFREGFFKGHRR